VAPLVPRLVARFGGRAVVGVGFAITHFIHRTGRGVGITTHEPPYMVEGETHLVKPGMCFSIEPGIYLPNRFGVRIEDIVTVTGEGGRRLNQTPLPPRDASRRLDLPTPQEDT
jgi:Xaa-Pro aminopeptidase